jgi:PKD repeat protein
VTNRQRQLLGLICCGLLLATGCAGGKRTVPVPDPLNQAPHARLTVDVSSGDSPWTVSFDATASSDADGTIRSYRWDYEGDGTYDIETTLAKVTRLTDTAGRFTAQLLVTDNDGGQDLATVDYSVGTGGGWQTVTVDSLTKVDSLTDQAGARTALAVVNGNPAICYGGNELHYARSGTALGNKAADWQKVTIPSESGQATQAVRIGTLTTIEGSPAIAFSNYKLHYARALSVDGLQDGDWTPLALNSDGPLSSVALAVVNGTPAIAYTKAGVADDPLAHSSDVLGFFHASTATAMVTDEWQAPIALVAADETRGYDGVALRDVATTPALTVVGYVHDAAAQLRTVELRYGSCTTTDGRTSTDWTFTPLQTRTYHDGDSQQVDIGQPSFALVDNVPTLACMIKTWSVAADRLHVNELDELLYTRAETGIGGGTWRSLTLDTVPHSFLLAAAGDPVVVPESAPALAVVAGAPAVAYPPQLARSAAPDGLAATTWRTEAVDSGYGVALAELNGQPALCYLQQATSTAILVKYAVFVP